MSKRDNTLLNESQIRQFMKLAELTPLADGFVTGLMERGGKAGEEDDEPGEKGRKDYTAKRERPGEDVRKSAPKRGAEGTEGKEGEGDAYVKQESHGRGRKEGAAGYGHEDQNSRNEALDADPEALEDYALGDEERGEPEEAAEDELEAAEEEDPLEDELGPDRTVSVDDFLAALETALEDVLGDEVEVEQEEEEEVELAPEEEEIELADVGVEDELQLQEMVNLITKRVAKRIVKEALKKS